MYILRNKFLNTASFLLAPPNEGEQDTRSDAQKERDAIEINDSTDGEDKNRAPVDTEDKTGDEEDNDEEENKEEDEKDKDENKDEEEDKNKEETDEEKTARLAKEKEDRKQARQQRKWDKLAAEKTAAERERDELKRRLEEKPVEGLTEEEVERRAAEKVAEKLREKQLEDAKKEFEDNCDTLEAAAIKIDTNFPRKVQELAEDLGPIPRAVINTLAELDNKNGGAVLNYLADNVDEAEEIYDLRNNERRLAIKLTRLSDKLKEEAKPVRRERSNVPPPITPVDGAVKDNNRITGKETQEEFNAKRARQIEERNKQRGYN